MQALVATRAEWLIYTPLHMHFVSFPQTFTQTAITVRYGYGRKWSVQHLNYFNSPHPAHGGARLGRLGRWTVSIAGWLLVSFNLPNKLKRMIRLIQSITIRFFVKLNYLTNFFHSFSRFVACLARTSLLLWNCSVCSTFSLLLYMGVPFSIFCQPSGRVNRRRLQTMIRAEDIFL